MKNNKSQEESKKTSIKASLDDLFAKKKKEITKNEYEKRKTINH